MLYGTKISTLHLQVLLINIGLSQQRRLLSLFPIMYSLEYIEAFSVLFKQFETLHLVIAGRNILKDGL